MSTLFHCFLARRKQPQAEKKSRVAVACEGFCAATRVALDLFGAVATFACKEGMPAQLSDQVLAITANDSPAKSAIANSHKFKERAWVHGIG